MRFEEFRVARNMTYQALADFFGLPGAGTAYRYAHGWTIPRERRMRAICERSGWLITPGDWYSLADKDAAQ